jgi:hypothetical protein
VDEARKVLTHNQKILEGIIDILYGGSYVQQEAMNVIMKGIKKANVPPMDEAWRINPKYDAYTGFGSSTHIHHVQRLKAANAKL